MKKFKMMTILLATVLIVVPRLCPAQEEVLKVGEIQVTAPREKESIVVAPSTTTINVEDYKMPGTPQNVTDILKDRAIIDFRGQSDLVPSNDTIQMRGFGGKRFVTAIDGLIIEKSGFGYSNYAVDYALLSPGHLEKIEIMPGPHSALYSGQSIGGVINLITRSPKRAVSLKPNVNVTADYKSYNTQNYSADVDGGIDSFSYGFGFQNYYTDGYLRHNKTEINTFYGRMGWIFPSEGYIDLSGSYTDQDREMAVNNAISINDYDYDSDYPIVTAASYDPWQVPTRDKKGYSFRLKGKQPTFIGLWSLGAYYNKENHDQFNLEYIDSKDPSKGVRRGSHARDVVWDQVGGKIQNEIKFSEDHTSTLGFDMVVAHSGRQVVSRHKRLDRKAAYLQHDWKITPSLTLTGGLRYEDVATWIHNRATDRSTGELLGYYNNAIQEDYIERNFNEFVPKSFLAWRLDDISPALRDTSLSLGVSKIWHAPTSGMDMHGNGLPGFHVEPEHGIGYDLIFMRRLWRNINLKVDFAFYEIKDYIAYNNREYAEYIPGPTNPVSPGLEYKDARINLDKVARHGIELELGGYILNNLSFYITYAYQEFKNKGSELVAKEELDDRAKHRISAGLRYNPFENTLLMLDYKYQSKQVAYNSKEVATDEWVFYSIPMDAYHLFDFGVEQILFRKYGFIRDGTLKFYVNNLLDEEYENSRGYPMTDRTFGVAVSFGF